MSTSKQLNYLKKSDAIIKWLQDESVNLSHVFELTGVTRKTLVRYRYGYCRPARFEVVDKLWPLCEQKFKKR